MKAFLKAGILGEDRLLRENHAGTPQGSILSPLLSNVALTILDEHIAQGAGGPRTSQTERVKRHRHCLPNYRLRAGSQYVTATRPRQCSRPQPRHRRTTRTRSSSR